MPCYSVSYQPGEVSEMSRLVLWGFSSLLWGLGLRGSECLLEGPWTGTLLMDMILHPL